MNCHYCYGVDTIKEELTQFCSWQMPAPFVVENIPALVCIQCSETIFPGKVNPVLDHLLDEIKAGRVAPTTVRAVPFYDFQQPRPSESPRTAIRIEDAHFVPAKTLNSPLYPVAKVASGYQFQPLPSSPLIMYANPPMPGYRPYTASVKDLFQETVRSHAAKSATVR